MTKDEFDDFFRVLDKASDRLRTVIYVFTIVFTSMLIYGIGAFAYPTDQYMYESIDLEARCHAAQYPEPDCNTLREKMLNRDIRPPIKIDNYDKMMQHELDVSYDKSVKARSFSFPVFGFETDRDLIWILFPLVGIFGYYILLLALGSVIRLFEFLMQQNVPDGFRLRLIQSTLVITAPLKEGKPERTKGDLKSSIRLIWLAVAMMVCAIPMIVSILIVQNQLNFLPVYLYKVAGELFFDKPTPELKLQLAVEGFFIFIQGALFLSLVGHAREFGNCQKIVEAHIARAELAPALSTSNAPGQVPAFGNKRRGNISEQPLLGDRLSNTEQIAS